MKIIKSVYLIINYKTLLVSLDNIQDHLENPYDQVGEDDIKIDPERYISLLQYGIGVGG